MESGTNISEAGTGRGRGDIADFSIAIVSGLAFVLMTIFLCVVPLTGKIAGGRDFVVYWATGQQLAHHANPYDPDGMARIERSAGIQSGYGVLFMRNPPWGLCIALPLGFVDLRTAAFLWTLILLGCLLLSVRMLWQMHGRPRNHLEWLGFSFAPAVLCLLMGQTALFTLLGLVLFLRLHSTRPFLAGVSLWLCALKPHLFLTFAVVLLAWIVVSRSYKVLAGAAVAMAASCAVQYWIDPMAWTQYAQMIRTSGIEKEFIPCLSVVLHLWVSPQSLWLQYLASALACAWALGYYWKRRHAWDWLKESSLLMIVSIVAAPYCWLFDQAVAIPAMLHGAFLTRSRLLLVVLALASVVIEIELVSSIPIPSVLYLWTAPAWFAWYLLARAFVRKPGDILPQGQ